LGITVGAVTSGGIRPQGQDFASVFITPWFQPFPIAVGILALALFAYLAASYLTMDTTDPQLRDDFRLRALVSGAVATAVAVVVFFLAKTQAPDIWHHLKDSWHAHVAAAIFAIAAIISLAKRRFEIARVCAAGQVAFILWGWAVAQFPYLVRPHLTIFNAAGPHSTLTMLLIALCVGAVLLFPSFIYLFIVFKGRPRPASQTDSEH